MVEAGSSFLGRSILTPKPTTNKPTARRTGNWQPPRREHGPEHKRGDSATSPSEGVQRAEQPRPQPRTSEIGSAPKSARPAPTASRFQAEVDRIEKERDEDDSTFVDSQSQTLTERSSVVDSLSQLGISQELSQDTLRINREHATAATPSRRSGVLTSQSERRSAGPLLMETQAAQPNQQN